MIVFRAAKDRVHVIAFSPDGATLAAGVPGGVSFWDLASGQEMKKLRPKENTRYLCPVYSLAFHPGGESLAAGGPELRLWDLRTGAAAILQGWSYIGKLLFSRDGSVLFGSGRYHESQDVDRFDVQSRQPLPSWNRGHPSPGMGLSVDGSLFASSHYLPPPRRGRRYDHFVLVRDATTGKIHATFHDCTHSVSDLAFSPCGDILAGVAGPSLHIWNLATKRQVGVKKLGKLHFQALAFTPDGRFLGTASNDETARFWDTRTWEVATTFTWKIGRMLDIAFAPDGLRAAASGSSGKVVVWDVDI